MGRTSEENNNNCIYGIMKEAAAAGIAGAWLESMCVARCVCMCGRHMVGGRGKGQGEGKT